MIAMSPQFTQRNYSWTQWKTVYAAKGSPFQYDDDGILYSIWTYDGPDVHMCQIWKGVVPDPIANSTYTQNQNDTDRTDFETSYKPTGNAPLSQLDTDGAQIVRMKAAKRGWSFWSVPIEVVTSTLGATLFCQDNAGIAIPWITAKIYDGNNAEITTAGLLNANLNTCIKTVVDFEPNFNFEIIGGSLRVNSNPTQDVRLWIVAAPDIPAIYGGSKEFASGINLKFLSADNSWEVDGRVTKSVSYDAVNHSGKLRMIIKHPAGLQVNLMFVAQLFRQ